MSSDANIVSEYINITDKYKKIYGNKTLLLMMVGAFYEIYALKDKNENIRGSNITEACSICELNISDGKKQMIGNEYLLMAGFRDYSIEKYIPKLLDTEYTVVVYNQIKTPTKITTATTRRPRGRRRTTTTATTTKQQQHHQQQQQQYQHKEHPAQKQ